MYLGSQPTPLEAAAFQALPREAPPMSSAPKRSLAQEQELSNSTIYDDNLGARWNIITLNPASDYYQVPGAGVHDSNATCATLQANVCC